VPHPVPLGLGLRAARGAVQINTIEGLTHRLVLRPPPGATPNSIAHEITTLVRAYTQLRH
jgi:hypothetical protein